MIAGVSSAPATVAVLTVVSVATGAFQLVAQAKGWQLDSNGNAVQATLSSEQQAALEAYFQGFSRSRAYPEFMQALGFNGPEGPTCAIGPSLFSDPATAASYQEPARSASRPDSSAFVRIIGPMPSVS